MSADPPHLGHIKLIERVMKMGFVPILVLNDDEFIESYKERKVFMKVEERIGYFSDAFRDLMIYRVSKEDQRSFIKTINPTVIVVGMDWLRPDIISQLGLDEEFLEENDISFLVMPRTPNISSSELR